MHYDMLELLQPFLIKIAYYWNAIILKFVQVYNKDKNFWRLFIMQPHPTPTIVTCHTPHKKQLNPVQKLFLSLST